MFVCLLSFYANNVETTLNYSWGRQTFRHKVFSGKLLGGPLATFPRDCSLYARQTIDGAPRRGPVCSGMIQVAIDTVIGIKQPPLCTDVVS